MGLYRGSIYATLFSSLLLTVSCAEKTKAPESLTLKMMRLEAEATTYETDVVNVDPLKINSVSRVAFISNIDQNRTQDLWKVIANNNPQLVVIAGNSVHSTKYDQKPLLSQFKKLDQAQDYRQLREKVPFMAIWDELDYGIKNGDSAFPGKNENKEAFKKYWKYISKLQNKNQKGLEHSLILGPAGKRLQLIFLDTRSFATPWMQTASGEFKKNWQRSATILGDTQWAWLESELKKEADHRVVISPLQMAANSWNGERWGLFPHERQRFFDTLRKTQAKNVFIISGGRNFAALGKVNLIKYPPLYDLTVGPLNEETQNPETDSHYLGNAITSTNFGIIDWNWENKTLQLKLIDQNNKTVFSQELRFVNESEAVSL